MNRFSTMLLYIIIAVVTPAFSTTITLEQTIRQTCQNSDSSRMMKETLIKSQLMIREQRAAAFPAVSGAMDGRSDLASIEWLIKVNMTGSSISRSMYLPNVIGRASCGAGGNDPADMADFDSRNWSVGVGLQWRIFDGLSNSIKAEQYRSDARKLEAARDAIKKMIEIEVVSALAECAAADSNRIASTEILAAAREGYELTNTNFKGGSGLFVEVQDADERLMLAEIGDLQARCRFIRSRAVLQVAMGKDILTKEEI
jgi:outer membrane protein